MTRAFWTAPRITGLIYLVVVLTGIASLAYVPSQILVAGDDPRTVANLQAAPSLWRLGIAAGMACYLAFIALPLSFYRWMAPVHRSAAQCMVLLAVLSVPMSLGNLGHQLEVLDLVTTPAAAAQDQVLRALVRYRQGVLLAELFWGLWLLPLGFLVLRSRAVPMLLGGLLILGGLGYLIEVFGSVLWADWRGGWFTRPAALGEIGTCLWLLVFGAKAPEPATAAVRVAP
ncbi:DUF4386 domain-containing protein [Inhella sp.]|uniref:DUF4386 domain-containing protein n=1 Tax=Inhella sp. TaxID=1921806 RepID=UPI0035B1B023